MSRAEKPGEKIVRLGLKTNDGTMYFIKDGGVWATPQKKRGQAAGKAARVAVVEIDFDYGSYLYYLDDDGDLARKRRTTKSPAKQEPTEPLVAFSWGYSGWGPYTNELVMLFDKVETARGFEPPLFVDVRLKRAARAPGFREKAFEQLLGSERHVWMPDLGNLAIQDDSISMTIARPEAAGELLDRIADAAGKRRRVVFFCSCESPRGRPNCHRGAVTKLLLAVARKRGMKLAVQEWPGTEPALAEVTVEATDFKTLRAQARTNDSLTSIALPAEMSLADAGALAHFTVLRCAHEGEHVWAISGPAVYTARGWRLPVYEVFDGHESGKAILTAQLADFTDFELARQPAKPAR